MNMGASSSCRTSGGTKRLQQRQRWRWKDSIRSLAVPQVEIARGNDGSTNSVARKSPPCDDTVTSYIVLTPRRVMERDRGFRAPFVHWTAAPVDLPLVDFRALFPAPPSHAEDEVPW